MAELEVTSAEQYAQLEAPDDEIEIVPMPSGANWKMRRVDILGLTMIGALPQSLVNIGLVAWEKQGKVQGDDVKREVEAAIADQSPEESAELMIFYRQTVVDNVLAPRIHYNESGVVSLLNEAGKPITKVQIQDFRYAFKWITRQEGKEAPGLSKFREGSERGVATVGDDGTGQRGENIIAAETTQ